MKEQEKVGWGWAGSQYSANNFVKYRLTREKWLVLFGEQDGKCGGCGEELAHAYVKEMRVGLKPEVDHDHSTGKVRGLLCRRCNDFLGKIKDNQKTLEGLARYLQRHGEKLL